MFIEKCQLAYPALPTQNLLYKCIVHVTMDMDNTVHVQYVEMMLYIGYQSKKQLFPVH